MVTELWSWSPVSSLLSHTHSAVGGCLRELSHTVPDMSIHGSLSSVHCSLNLEHYQLVRGLLENNLGEPVEDFLRPYNLQDPSSYVRNCSPLNPDSRVHS